MSFEEYLISKKIDPKAFKRNSGDQFESLKTLFEQVHPNSFTAQKLFLINDIRRSNPLKQESEPNDSARKQLKPKVKIRPKSK